ncbi:MULTISPECIES: DUF2066 domain-containing protein [unclassified Pseudoalteromonas]|uniref:DUF2066 domain-containing protein n=1 Tax=unclassified Pseudoalteromonas TaxID=194690 RepID=UPI000CF72148|nr:MULTISPECIES: DUF2066 domain-containing protein [unclassified Pseudoalteromonas]
MIRNLLLLVIAFGALPLQAIEVKDLYQYRQPVEDKTRTSRATASQNALLNVLVKVTGDANAAENSKVRAALPDIASYMTKYEYADNKGESYLQVEFDGNKVNALVRDAGLPLWGNRRPLVAIWLAIEDGWRRELMTADSYPQIQEQIAERASRRGVPVVTPLFDLEDHQHVTVADVWGNFSDSLDIASERYMAERVVSARLYKDENTDGWALEWRFTNEDQFEGVKHQGEQQEVVGDMIDALASALASEYAIDASSSYEAQQQTLKLYNTQNFVDIEYAVRRLKSLSVVTDAAVTHISQELVEIRISHTGGVEDLKKALTLDSYFSDYRDPQKFYYSNSNDALEYAWQ